MRERLKENKFVLTSLLVVILSLTVGFGACSKPVTVTVTAPNQPTQAITIPQNTTPSIPSSTSLYSTTLNEVLKDGAITESDTGRLVVARLYDLATTYDKKQLLAELRDKWGISEQRASKEGGWVQFHLDGYEVKGNKILEPILGIYNDYYFEWNVSPDGLILVPSNGNAIRIEAEFVK